MLFIRQFRIPANVTIIAMRDRVLREEVPQQEFVEALQQALELRYLDDSAQIKFLLTEPPSGELLASARGRAQIAEQLDLHLVFANAVIREF